MLLKLYFRIAWSLPPTYVFEGMRALLIDHVFRTDLMLAWEQPRYDVKLNVLNVFNKRYYEALYENGGFAVPGTERAFQLTATVRF